MYFVLVISQRFRGPIKNFYNKDVYVKLFPQDIYKSLRSLRHFFKIKGKNKVEKTLSQFLSTGVLCDSMSFFLRLLSLRLEYYNKLFRIE